MGRIVRRASPRDKRWAAVREAQAARRIVEAALDRAGWPWRRRLSLWVDALLVVEEGGR